MVSLESKSTSTSRMIHELRIERDTPARYSCRSLPQIPHHSTSTSAIPGLSAGMGTSSNRMSLLPWYRAARAVGTAGSSEVAHSVSRSIFPAKKEKQRTDRWNPRCIGESNASQPKFR